MPATPWTPLSLATATEYSTDFYVGGPPVDFVIIGGAALPVDADGNPVAPVTVTDWTELTIAATAATELTGVSATWTELTL